MTCRFSTAMNSLIPFLRKSNLLLLLLLSAILFSCREPKNLKGSNQLKNIPDKDSSAQGISGKILFKEGKFLLNGEISENGSIYAVQRPVFICELTNTKEVEMWDGDFVKSIYTEVMDTLYSDENGSFFARLAPGKYSIFIQENERLYSKLDQNEEYYFPVAVSPDSVTKVVFEIDYMAKY